MPSGSFENKAVTRSSCQEWCAPQELFVPWRRCFFGFFWHDRGPEQFFSFLPRTWTIPDELPELRATLEKSKGTFIVWLGARATHRVNTLRKPEDGSQGETSLQVLVFRQASCLPPISYIFLCPRFALHLPSAFGSGWYLPGPRPAELRRQDLDF